MGGVCNLSGQCTAIRQIPAIAYYVSVNLGEVELDALVDTGATVSIISGSIVDKNPALEKYMVESTLTSVRGVSGVELAVRCDLLLKLNVGSLSTEPHRIHIVDNSAHNFILGMEFFDRYKLCIDAERRKLRYRSERGYESLIEIKPVFPNPRTFSVINEEVTVIPPRSQQIVAVCIPQLEDSTEGCIEPRPKDNKPLLIARSLNLVQDGVTYVKCINPTNETIKLEENEKIATFTPVYLVENIVSVAAKSPPVDKAFDLEGTDLGEKEKERVKKLINKYEHVVSVDGLDLGCTQTIKHRIDVQGANPVKQPYRRFPNNLKIEISGAIKQMLSQNIIETSNSSWSSPLVPVRKKNGKLRLCVDYRAVNALTKKDSFPLPNMNDAVSQFRDSRYFSSLDLVSGYHQIEMDPDSREITAFSDGENLYQYTRMPFGVTNGPASFSRLVSVLLSGIPLNQAQAYLDDILVAGKTFEDHLQNLETIFSRLADHGLKLNASKCELFRSEVKYLGHLVGRDGVQPLNDNVKAIELFPRPTSIKQLRRFNGMVNFYKRFIPDSANLMRPLYAATSGKLLKWTEECEEAFQSAKRTLIRAPILAYPDFADDSIMILTTDASGSGAGAVLTQYQEGEEKVLGYAGTMFSTAQSKYSATERELAAIRFAVNHFKAYLYGRKFIVRTDHEPLIYLYQTKRFDSRLHRTLEDLNIGIPIFEYIPGKRNTVADALSRANYPWVIPAEYEPKICTEILKSLDDFTVVAIAGGSDSLCEAVSSSMNRLEESSAMDENETVRSRAVDMMTLCPERYGYTDTRSELNKIELFRDSETFLPFHAIQAVADAMAVHIEVYFSKGPVLRIRPFKGSDKWIFLRCSGGVHFDSLEPKEEFKPVGVESSSGVEAQTGREDLLEARPSGYSLEFESQGNPNISEGLPGIDVREGCQDVQTRVRELGCSQELKSEGNPKSIEGLAMMNVLEGDQVAHKPLKPAEWEELKLNSSMEEILEYQRHDEQIQKILKICRRGQLKVEDFVGDLSIFKPKFKDLVVSSDNLLKLQRMNGGVLISVPVAPQAQLIPLAEALHKLLAHAGRDKMIAVMQKFYAHPCMFGAISKVVKECWECQCHKGKGDKNFPIHRRNPIKPFELYAVDLMELPKTTRGYCAVLVGIDLFTKFGHVIPLRNKRSNGVAKALEATVLSTVPKTPERILSDNGPEFRGKPFRQLLERYGIKHEHSVPYAPHTNGAVERLNRTLKEKLAAVCHGNERNWDEEIFGIIAQYNRTPHSETGKAPGEFFFEHTAGINIPKQKFWREGKDCRYHPGDLVLRKVPYHDKDHTKLSPKYEGPYAIISVDSNGVTYEIRKVQGKGKLIKVHISQIKKFYGNTIPEEPKPKRRSRSYSPQQMEMSYGINWEALDFIPSGLGGGREETDGSSEGQNEELGSGREETDSLWEGQNEQLGLEEMAVNREEEALEVSIPQASSPEDIEMIEQENNFDGFDLGDEGIGNRLELEVLNQPIIDAPTVGRAARPVTRKRVCPECGRTFTGERGFNSHLRTHRR